MSEHKKPETDAKPEADAALGPVRLAANYTDGGHEIDYTPNRNLFGFLAVMVAVMVLSAIGVYQLFVTHTEGQLADAATSPSSQLADQRARDQQLSTSYGHTLLDANGLSVAGPPTPDSKVVGFRMPFAEAKRLVLADPTRFSAAAKPEGWIHPDDQGKKTP